MQAIHWFADTIAGNVIGIILSLVVATMLAYLKERATSVRWGLTGFLLVIGIWAGFHCISYFSYASDRVKPLVTEDNVETNIRNWAYAFGASVTPVSDLNDEGPLFAMNIRPKNCPFEIIVSRPKAYPHYVAIGASLELSEEHKSLLAKLNAQQARQLFEELRLELSRCRVTHEIVRPVMKVSMETRIPITDDLTEDVFMRRLEEIQHDMNLATDTIVLGLERKVREAQQPPN